MDSRATLENHQLHVPVESWECNGLAQWTPAHQYEEHKQGGNTWEPRSWDDVSTYVFIAVSGSWKVTPALPANGMGALAWNLVFTNQLKAERAKLTWGSNFKFNGV